MRPLSDSRHDRRLHRLVAVRDAESRRGPVRHDCASASPTWQARPRSSSTPTSPRTTSSRSWSCSATRPWTSARSPSTAPARCAARPASGTPGGSSPRSAARTSSSRAGARTRALPGAGSRGRGAMAPMRSTASSFPPSRARASRDRRAGARAAGAPRRGGEGGRDPAHGRGARAVDEPRGRPRRGPRLCREPRRIHAMGGTIDAPGNIDIETTSPADMVEWNFGVDPDALAAVLATDVPVTMVGLDATNHVPVPADIEQVLARTPPRPAPTSPTSCTSATRSSSRAARSGTRWRRCCCPDPSIATWEDVPVRVETAGRSAGRTARDPSGRTVHAAMNADKGGSWPPSSRRSGPARPRPGGRRSPARSPLAWDGTRCRVRRRPSAGRGRPGEVREPVGRPGKPGRRPRRGAAHLGPGRRVGQRGRPRRPDPRPPAWIVPVNGSAQRRPGRVRQTVATLGPAATARLCAPAPGRTSVFNDGGAFEVKG